MWPPSLALPTHHHRHSLQKERSKAHIHNWFLAILKFRWVCRVVRSPIPEAGDISWGEFSSIPCKHFSMPVLSFSLNHPVGLWATCSEIALMFGEKLPTFAIGYPSHPASCPPKAAHVYSEESFFHAFTMLMKVHSIRLLYESPNYHSFWNRPVILWMAGQDAVVQHL